VTQNFLCAKNFSFEYEIRFVRSAKSGTNQALLQHHCLVRDLTDRTQLKNKHDKIAKKFLFSNLSTLKHYVVQIHPDFPLQHRRRTSIRFNEHTYTFQGFSLFFHKPVAENFPAKWLNRMFPEYSVRVVEAPPVEVSF
jgi:hypothetical protein